MIIKAVDIKYDTDGINGINGKKVSLPEAIFFQVDDLPPDELEEEMDERLADMISDVTGWCVLSCKYENVAKLPRKAEAVDCRSIVMT